MLIYLISNVIISKLSIKYFFIFLNSIQEPTQLDIRKTSPLPPIGQGKENTTNEPMRSAVTENGVSGVDVTDDSTGANRVKPPNVPIVLIMGRLFEDSHT